MAGSSKTSCATNPTQNKIFSERPKSGALWVLFAVISMHANKTSSLHIRLIHSHLLSQMTALVYFVDARLTDISTCDITVKGREV
ncbi:hypothetical protein BDR04DRAFT_1102098 [Suillus decipiens]|nr:hypothetical protein BDR04DRAFT_1102098 [Suillus decipiens]